MRSPFAGYRVITGALIMCVTLTGIAHAQVFVGTVVDAQTDSLVQGAVVTLLDTTGVTIAETRTNQWGRYTLTGTELPVVQFLVRSVGLSPARSQLVEVPDDADTLSVDLVAPRIGITLASVRVVASRIMEPNFNTYQLRDARQNGWRIIEPHKIAEDRGNVAHLGDLIRRNPLPGVRPPPSGSGCYRYTRTNRCLSLIVDGQVVGPDAHVAPGDVYFIAFVSAQDAAVKYGSRAREGAIFIATRRRGDDERDPKNVP